ncbi:MAG: hypothetical protein HZC36_14535 [Armatimonadetes bacterium]|nr:hypothetical protein [Armatimonadota bacterium]
MKKNVLFLTSALVFSLLLAAGGCNSGGASTENSSDSSASSSDGAAQGADGAPKQNTGPEKTVNSPSEAMEGGSYRIAPANPNDPKFKQDPNLGGGG